MTPHLMEQIRDSQGDLVTAYNPKPWMQPISAQAAATLTTYMQGVVKSGTAANVFPASWDVAAKTGTAEVGPGLQQTTDWLIAFPRHRPTPRWRSPWSFPIRRPSRLGPGSLVPLLGRSSATCSRIKAND